MHGCIPGYRYRSDETAYPNLDEMAEFCVVFIYLSYLLGLYLTPKVQPKESL